MFSRVSKSHFLKGGFYSLNLVAGKREHFWKRHLIYFFKTCRSRLSHFIILFLLKNGMVTSANGQRISLLSIAYGDCLWYNFTLMFLKIWVTFFHIYIKLHHTLHLPTHQYFKRGWITRQTQPTAFCMGAAAGRPAAHSNNVFPVDRGNQILTIT